jgi:hypothetical protein
LALCALWLVGSAAGPDPAEAAARLLERWASGGITLVLLVAAVAMVVALIRSASEPSFALHLTAVGLGLLVTRARHVQDSFAPG